MILLGESAKNVQSIENKELNIIAFVEDKAIYEIYDDDGISKDYLNGIFDKLRIEIIKDKEEFDINIDGNIKDKKLNITIISKGSKDLKKVYYI